jgi:hypothetical protein
MVVMVAAFAVREVLDERVDRIDRRRLGGVRISLVRVAAPNIPAHSALSQRRGQKGFGLVQSMRGRLVRSFERRRRSEAKTNMDIQYPCSATLPALSVERVEVSSENGGTQLCYTVAMYGLGWSHFQGPFRIRFQVTRALLT